MNDCWGCAGEPAIDAALGAACRAQLSERRQDPATPRLNAMITQLEGVYARLCWNCEVAISTTLGGLCPRCDAVLR